MKLLVAVTLCLLVTSGCQANFLDGLKSTFNGIGDAFKTTFQQVGEQAKQVGQGLLTTLQQQGTQLAGQALQSLLLGSMNALQGQGSTSGNKREIADLSSSLEKFIGDKMEKYKTLYNTAVDALTTVGAMIPKDSKLTSVVSTVDEIVHSHHAAANKLTDELVEGIVQHFAKALSLSGHKRNAFTDLLGKVGSSVASLFQPSVESGKSVIGALGESVKQAAAQTATTAQPHVDAIQTSGQAVLQHGKNALQALKDAVTDILKQTITNIQPHLANIAQHATQTVVDSGHQFVNSLGQHMTNALSGMTQTQQQPVVSN